MIGALLQRLRPTKDVTDREVDDVVANLRKFTAAVKKVGATADKVAAIHAIQVRDRYRRWIGPLTEAARANGYALAVHGSLARDIDLIAVPWTDEAAAPHVLVEALRAACGGYLRDYPDANPSDFTKRSPEPKAHGRLAFSIYPSDGVTYFDVSVMPTAQAPKFSHGASVDVVSIEHLFGRRVDQQLEHYAAKLAKRSLRAAISAYLAGDFS